MIKAHSFVLVGPTGSGLQRSYPASKWIKHLEVVRLLENAPHEGTLDVIDVVRMSNGQEESIYDFNIIGKVTQLKGL